MPCASCLRRRAVVLAGVMVGDSGRLPQSGREFAAQVVERQAGDPGIGTRPLPDVTDVLHRLADLVPEHERGRWMLGAVRRVLPQLKNRPEPDVGNAGNKHGCGAGFFTLGR